MRVPKIVKNTFIYGLMNGFGLIIPILFLPVVTKYLTPDDYGHLTNLQNLILFAIALVRFETPAFLKRELVQAPESFSSQMGAGISLSAILFVLVLTAGLILELFHIKILEFRGIWLSLAACIAFGRQVIATFIGVQQIANRAWAVGVVQNLSTVLLYGFLILFIVKLGQTWESRATADLIVSSVLLGPITFFILKKKFHPQFKQNAQSLKTVFRACLPLAIFVVAAYTLETSDQFMVNHFLDTQILGFYKTALQIAGIFYGVFIAFSPAWEAWLYNHFKNSSFEKKFQPIKLYLLFCLGCTILAAVFLPTFRVFAGYLLNERFLAAVPFVGFGLMVFLTRIFLYLLFPFFIYHKKTKELVVAVLGAAVIATLLSSVWVESYGVLGVAGAMAIAHVTAALFLLMRIFQRSLLAKV